MAERTEEDALEEDDLIERVETSFLTFDEKEAQVKFKALEEKVIELEAKVAKKTSQSANERLRALGRELDKRIEAMQKK